MGSGDEREGLPSASGIEQLKLCPGSFNYKKLFPRVESSDANEGSIRHDIIERVILGDMTLDDISDQQQHECTTRALMILEKIEAEMGVGGHDEQWLEKRVWLNHGEDKLYSAKYDLLRCYKTGDSYVHLLVDWKTLYGEHTPAQNNIQLLAQALAVYRNSSEVSKIYCALAEPFPTPTYSLVKYEPRRLDFLETMIQEIVGRLTSLMHQDSPASSNANTVTAWVFALRLRRKSKRLPRRNPRRLTWSRLWRLPFSLKNGR